jgi:DNA-binding ferritin-like protein (Dps family)
MDRTALIQALGAIAYGERKAYDEAKAKAATAVDDDERRAWRTIAAEELRHHKGFVNRLEALGADPDRAMRPYRGMLDRYHAQAPGDEIEAAVWSYLGEGIADDLLVWLRTVVDDDTAAFVDGVLVDEEGHNDFAVQRLNALLDADPANRRRAGRAVTGMARRMLLSGAVSPLRLGPFLRLGHQRELLGAVFGGLDRRVRALHIGTRDLVSL